MNGSLVNRAREFARHGLSLRGWWNLYVITATPLLCVVLFAFSSAPIYRRFEVVALMTVTMLAYFALAYIRHREHGIAPYESKGGPWPWLFAAMVLACLWAAAGIDLNSFSASFIIVPELFIVFDYLPALLTVTLLNAGFAVVSILRSVSPGAEDVRAALCEAAISVFFSAMIGWAIDRLDETNKRNAQLVVSLERQQRTIRQMSRQEGINAERQRMAGELHDTIAQSLASILALGRAAVAEIEGEESTAALQHLAMIVDASQEGLDDTRRLIANMAPSRLQSDGLLRTVNHIVQTTRDGAGLDIDLDCDRDLPILNQQAQVAVVRIVQEALVNVTRHAKATRVRIGIHAVSQEANDGKGNGNEEGKTAWIRVSIGDDGRGFDTASLDDAAFGITGHGYGCVDMRRRTRQLGGVFDITSQPGQGTTVTACLPYDHVVLQQDPAGTPLTTGPGREAGIEGNRHVADADVDAMEEEQ
jgi:signal transduction histidine kinase